MKDKDLTERLKATRIANSMTLNDVATVVDCHFTTLSQIERGIVGFSHAMRARLEDYLEAYEVNGNDHKMNGKPKVTQPKTIRDWSWAVVQMKSGRRVMVPVWSHGEYICMNSAGALLDEKNRAGFTIPAPVLTREDWRLALQAGDPGTCEWALKELGTGKSIRQQSAPNLVWKTTREQRQATDWELAE